MWRKIRDYIWAQYSEQAIDAHAFTFKLMAREILTAASACMTRLNYDRYITSLLLVLPLRPRATATSSGRLMPQQSTEATPDPRFEEVPSTSQTSVEPQGPGPAVTSAPAALQPVPTHTAGQAEVARVNRELFDSLRRQFGTQNLVTNAPGLTRKRANSLDATASRADDSKRLRHFETVNDQKRLNVPAFVARPSDHEIIIVSDDDGSDVGDDGPAWFDYDEPQQESSESESEGEHDDEDEPDPQRVSGRLREKKARTAAASSNATKGVVARQTRDSDRSKRRSGRSRRGSARQRGSEKPAKAKPKAKHPKSKLTDDMGDADTNMVEPWQGPINLEPFEGGIGLADEDLPVDKKSLDREARLFPGPARPTDQYWKRRVCVCKISICSPHTDTEL